MACRVEGLVPSRPSLSGNIEQRLFQGGGCSGVWAFPNVRLRKEEFGYTLAFADGDIDWYRDSVGPLLLAGASKRELDAHRIDHLSVGDNFHLSAPLVAWLELTRKCNLPCKFSPIGRGRHFPELVPTTRLAAQAARLYIRDAAHEQHMMSKTGLCFTKAFQKCYVLSKATRREFCGTALVYIQSDGEVYPCTTCSSVGRFRAGNIRETTFAEIWENGFRELRAISWDDFKGCKSCDLAKEPNFCTSRCPVMSEVYTGDPLKCGSTPYLMESLRLRSSH